MKWLVGLLMLVAVDVNGQTVGKPTGMYDCGPTPPSWVKLCTIADGEPLSNFINARQLSEQRGILWLLQLGYHQSIATPIDQLAEQTLVKINTAGLKPHIAGVAVREEWYEHLLNGDYTKYGLPASHPQGREIVRDWAGQQYGQAKAILGLPTVWITTVVNNDMTFGLHWWRPVPLNVDVVAVDAYVPQGGSFAQNVAPVLAHAESTTHLPLVLIPQWFYIPNDPLWSRQPTVSDVDQYGQWAQRPRWIASIGFTGRSRPSVGIVGLMDLPLLRHRVGQLTGE